MKSISIPYIPIIEIVISLMIIFLPLSNDSDLMNGIQSAKSFNFFYCILGLMVLSGITILFNKQMVFFRLTWIDVLLLILVLWITVNKYLIHEIHSLSLSYFELLGLSFLYIIIRFIDSKFYSLFLIAICISGIIQAIYGNLQLWDYYSSSHLGLYKMNGSFFNPGPFAGYLCGILPVAIGLYWSYKLPKSKSQNLTSKFGVIGKTQEKAILNTQESILICRLRALYTVLLYYVRNNVSSIKEKAKQKLILSISAITIISILLVLPAARSRAAWLGALAGVAYLACHRYNVLGKIRSFINGTTKFPFGSVRDKTKKLLLISLTTIILLGAGAALYFYKKDSANGRVLIWKVTSNIIKDYPLLGVGQNQFPAYYMKYQANYFKENPNSKYELVADDNPYVFNEFLKIWVENGVFAFLIFIFIIGMSLRGFWMEQSFSNSNSLKNKNDINLISQSMLIAITVFACFAYPSEILPIKLHVAILLAVIASLTTAKKMNFVQSANLNIWPFFKPIEAVTIVAILYFLYPRFNNLQQAYKIWSYSFQLYNYCLYEDCIVQYKNAYPLLNHNGEFLLNYGKALCLAEKHSEAIAVLENSKKHLINTVTHTTLGNSFKSLGQYQKTEENYLIAGNMTPVKLYSHYLLAKLYDEIGEKQKAYVIANSILVKEVKIHSRAVDEIKLEMKRIIDKYVRMQ